MVIFQQHPLTCTFLCSVLIDQILSLWFKLHINVVQQAIQKKINSSHTVYFLYPLQSKLGAFGFKQRLISLKSTLLYIFFAVWMLCFVGQPNISTYFWTFIHYSNPLCMDKDQQSFFWLKVTRWAWSRNNCLIGARSSWGLCSVREVTLQLNCQKVAELLFI